MAKMTFLALEGCLFSSISNLIDAFHIADAWHRVLDSPTDQPLFETEIVTVDGRPIRACGNVRIHPDRSIAGVGPTDMILIPAFSQKIHLLTPKNNLILNWLKAGHAKGIPIAATCTGAFIVAEAGLLDHRTATTNWQFAGLFKRRYPQVRLAMDRLLTEDNGIICTGASTAVFHLGLHLIRRFGSESLAAVCAKAFLVDPNRQSQAPYIIYRSPMDHGDHQIQKAQRWMEAHYGLNFSIDEIAERVGISPRHFKRRFKRATGESPLAFLQNVRVEAAKRKLETTRHNVNEITCLIGYEDSSTFRRLFKKHTGISPREYRDKFGRRNAA